MSLVNHELLGALLSAPTPLRDFLQAPTVKAADVDERRRPVAKSALAVGSWKDWSHRKQQMVKCVIMLRFLEVSINNHMRDTRSNIGQFLSMNERLTNMRQQVSEGSSRGGRFDPATHALQIQHLSFEEAISKAESVPEDPQLIEARTIDEASHTAL